MFVCERGLVASILMSEGPPAKKARLESNNNAIQDKVSVIVYKCHVAC